MNVRNAPSDQAKPRASMIASQVLPVAIVHENTTQEVIVVTEDKLRLCLDRRLELLVQRRDWLIYGGVLATILAVLVVVPPESFQDIIFPKYAWYPLFVSAAILSSIALVRSLWRLWRSPSVEDVITELKGGATVIPGTSTASAHETSTYLEPPANVIALQGKVKEHILDQQPTRSGKLRNIAYRPQDLVLEVEIHDSVYQYFGVPNSAYVGFMEAASKEQYFDAQISDKYNYQRVA